MRHLTRKPKSPAAQALRALSLTLTETTQAAFEAALKRWYELYAAFLNERSVNEETGCSHYTHKRLRSAYNSLKRHLPWLFTCERFPDWASRIRPICWKEIQRNEAAFAVSSGFEERE